MLKILIILVYFERYNIVKNALSSIKELNYDNWELAFIDDGSVDYPGEPIVRDILKDYLSKIRFYNTHDTVEDKYRNGGSRHGLFMTQATLDSDADISFTLCDDDAVTPEYLNGIHAYFTKNPDKKWGYSHMIVFDPVNQDYHAAQINATGYNHHTGPINPPCVLDSSQVVYKSECIKEVQWNYPQTGGLDAGFFEKMYNKYGPCEFMGCVGQYKGMFSDQMSKRSDYIIKVH